ncbi:hypothetical protein DFH09DRAFT_1066970 [Mycena vulgaris]|nr:hypothetical protein DFH09DRAFT_1066970 [Mycena vulgaris]
MAAYCHPAYFTVPQPGEQSPHTLDVYFTVQQPTARAQPRQQAQRRDTSVDACLYTPGLYRIPTAPPTPAALLSGAYTPAGECIEYFPRRPALCARPSLSIAFTVHARPAPYLKDLLRGRVRVDGAENAVMREHGWSRTRWVLEWPGYERAPRGLAVAGLTRGGLAEAVAAEVALFLREVAAAPAPLALGEASPWAARNVHFGDVRLVALNYYGRVWVPILAFDAP